MGNNNLIGKPVNRAVFARYVQAGDMFFQGCFYFILIPVPSARLTSMI